MSSGPLRASSETPAGGAWPRIALKNAKLAVATCFTSCAKVRTPLKLPMESLGAKLYLSSGMASAAETNSCSTIESWVLSSEEIVGGAAGLAAVLGFAACWAEAAIQNAKKATVRPKTVAVFFIFRSLEFWCGSHLPEIRFREPKASTRAAGLYNVDGPHRKTKFKSRRSSRNQRSSALQKPKRIPACGRQASHCSQKARLVPFPTALRGRGMTTKKVRVKRDSASRAGAASSAPTKN